MNKKRTENDIKETVSSVTKEVLNESSLNRVLLWMKEHDIACVTAFRKEFKNSTKNTFDDRPQEIKDKDKEMGNTKPEDKTIYEYTLAEKRNRNKKLKAYLLSLGYGVTNIHGNYIENYGTIDGVELGESGFFVVNLNNSSDFKECIFEISEYYNQDCFLYKPKGSEEAYNIGTNNAEYPGYGEEDNLGKLHIDIDNEFLSRVGNASFAFTNKENPKHDFRTYNFHTKKQDRILKEALELDTYDKYSRGSRMSIESIYEIINNNITKMKNDI